MIEHGCNNLGQTNKADISGEPGFAHEGLADASARLDPAEERSLAEEGIYADLVSWPQY